MAIVSIDPSTGEILRVFDALSPAVIETKLALAQQTFQTWKRTSFEHRSRILLGAAEILETEKTDIGRLMTAEMGKTLLSAVAEVEKCALACRHYAEHAEQYLREQPVSTNATHSFVKYQPLGPVLAVMPWNFPFWQVFRFAAPALMAGNVGLLKHSSNVPQCALKIEEVLLRAGFPAGCFQTLLIESNQVETIIEDSRVMAVTLTGSEGAGASVAKIAGTRIKKTVLELGGSDPFIVMPSASLDVAVSFAVKARIVNNGQSCIAAKRFIVADAIYDTFQEQFVWRMNALRVGNPMMPETDIGPLATYDVWKDLESQVERAVVLGAHVLTGGHGLPGAGYYFAPTVLTGVPRGSDVYYEELFGPVAMLFRARTVDEAIEIANDSPFGLGASVWTEDEIEQKRFIDEIDAGQVFVNAMVASDPRLPFGGIKRSGYGRELADVGLREFINVKTVWVK